MRTFVTFLLGLAIGYPALAQTNDPSPLRYAGQPVNFAWWHPEPATFEYKGLLPPTERLKELNNEHVPVLESIVHIRIEQLAEGDYEETTERARLFLTRSGIEEQGDIGFWVDASRESATIVQAYALLADGRRLDVDQNAIQLVADTEDNIFSDSFQVIVPFSGLEPGAIAVLVVKTQDHGAGRVLPWSNSYYARWFAPTREFDLKFIQSPDGVPVDWKTDLEQLDCRRDGELSVHCHASDLQALPIDPDVSYGDVAPLLVLAERTSWQELARRELDLVQSALSGGDAIRELASTLVKGATGHAHRIDRIHKFVSQEIRYVAIEQGVGDVTPRPSAVTLQRRYGDCKDKTTLFLDLARQAGLEAYPVLIASERQNPNKLLLPAPHYFDHMIACVKSPPRSDICVDLTDPTSAMSVRPAQGAVRLELQEDTRDVTASPADPYLFNVEIETINQFQADGSLNESKNAVYLSAHGAAIRSILQKKTATERARWALDGYHSTISKDVDPDFEFAGINDVDRPLSIRSVANYAGPYSPKSMSAYVETEAELIDAAWTVTSKNTYYDYPFVGIKYKGQTTFRLAAGTVITFSGPNVSFRSEFGTFKRSYRVIRDAVTVTSQFEMPRAVITQDKLAKFNRFTEFVRDQAKIWFSWEAMADGNNQASSD